jgi:hypothetical protein
MVAVVGGWVDVLVVPLKQMEVKEKVRGCQDGREMSIYWLTSLELSSRSGHESKRGWKGESSTFTSAVWPFLSPSHPRRRLGAERQTANLGLSVCKASIPFLSNGTKMPSIGQWAGG